METSLKTGFAQIFSCCPKNLSCPNFGGAAAPLAHPARTPMARCNEKRRALWSRKNQIDRVLSRIFIHSHCKVRSHNPKGGCACREKKKRIPDFDHTYCVQGLNITTSQNSITENGNRLNSLYWYKAIVRCTHLVARILQHGCKFSSWLKVNKISNQTVHHQSATKLDSMLQDIKKNTSL